jgi:hypothetical protein
MPFDQIQVRDYAVVIHAGNDEWTWQVMDFDARIAAQGEAPDRESAWRSGMFAAGAVGAFARIGRLLQEKKTAESRIGGNAQKGWDLYSVTLRS